MDDKEKFIQIFSGLERAYGQTQSRAKNDAGKIEAKSWIQKEQITKEKWYDHLEGREPSLGIIPIREGNTCNWGAIDIDSYDGLDHKKLIKKIVEKKLPLVVCRSKSGGAHIYLFVREPATAKDMQLKLTEIAAWLGYADSEIFPKQIELNPKATGNFLNLPYNHEEHPTRYAFDDEGNALDTLRKFIEYYETKVILQVSNVDIPKTVDTREDFKGAPPCIVTLAEQGFSEGSRNQCLFQVGIYLRERFPDEVEAKLDEYNTKYFKPPLPSREVLTICKQVGDDKYFYRCEEPTFKSVCEKIKCKTRKYGIGNSATDDNSSLKKWVSDNPMYELTHNGQVIILNVDQLADHPAYRKACIAQADTSPRPVGPLVWAQRVDELLAIMKEKKDYVILPGEVTVKGQFLSHLQTFIGNTKGAKDRDEIRLGQTYEHEGYFYFKPQSFREFLKTKRFTKINETHQMKIFNELKGSTDKLKIEGHSTHCWKIPIDIQETEYELKERDFKETDEVY